MGRSLETYLWVLLLVVIRPTFKPDPLPPFEPLLEKLAQARRGAPLG